MHKLQDRFAGLGPLEAALDPSLLWEELARDGAPITYLIADGLGGLPDPRRGKSELRAARTPRLDALAAESACGLIEPVAAGVTPGSGPGHLALFGYHPLRYRIGRGIFSALGIELDLREGDVAARVNFATADAEGRLEDRRAGRLPAEKTRSLCRRIRADVELGDDVEWFLEPLRGHRAVLVLRGDDLDGGLEDTDPHRTGVPPLPVRPRREGARRTAELVERLLEQVGAVLSEE